MKKAIILGLLAAAFLVASVGPAFAQAKGAFAIVCNVTGARVYLNGELAGYTKPTFSVLLRPGTYSVKVTLDKYRSFETVINMTSRPLNLPVNLVSEGPMQMQQVHPQPQPQPQPRRFNLTVSANLVGAQVFVNNAPVGTAPLSMQVDRGSYSLRVSAPGYEDYLVVVSVAGNTSVKAVLQPSFVSVEVVIPPGFLDSKSRNPHEQIRLFVDGQPNPGLSFNVSAGRHNIRITSGGFSFSSDFDFAPGRSYVLEPSFNWIMR